MRIAESFYRANTAPLIPRISRQNLVFLAEGQFADLIPRLSVDGVRRGHAVEMPGVAGVFMADDVRGLRMPAVDASNMAAQIRPLP